MFANYYYQTCRPANLDCIVVARAFCLPVVLDSVRKVIRTFFPATINSAICVIQELVISVTMSQLKSNIQAWHSCITWAGSMLISSNTCLVFEVARAMVP